ncbi:hypothetical protein C8Q73DRAFT_226006 [Cubamyces lactineus]|nr:hypothetical protein C8Q73DRAFT_226006 [Cubamyces lactineus]
MVRKHYVRAMHIQYWYRQARLLKHYGKGQSLRRHAQMRCGYKKTAVVNAVFLLPDAHAFNARIRQSHSATLVPWRAGAWTFGGSSCSPCRAQLINTGVEPCRCPRRIRCYPCLVAPGHWAVRSPPGARTFEPEYVLGVRWPKGVVDLEVNQNVFELVDEEVDGPDGRSPEAEVCRGVEWIVRCRAGRRIRPEYMHRLGLTGGGSSLAISRGHYVRR